MTFLAYVALLLGALVWTSVAVAWRVLPFAIAEADRHETWHRQTTFFPLPRRTQ